MLGLFLLIAEVVRFSVFLLPILFMLLFDVEKPRFDWLKVYGPLLFVGAVVFVLFFGDVGFNLELVVAYLAFGSFGVMFFSNRGWSFNRALSLSFCLVRFGGFLWELPIFVYTIVLNGGVDGAFPLTLLFLFPMLFVYEKVRVNRSKREIVGFVFSSVAFSVVVLWLVLVLDTFVLGLGMVNRVVTMLLLFGLYANANLRKKMSMK